MLKVHNTTKLHKNRLNWFEITEAGSSFDCYFEDLDIFRWNIYKTI